MHSNRDSFSMEDAMRLASSPAGQQLIALLKSAGGSSVEQARQAAAKGDYETAKTNLSKLLQSEDVQRLLKEMEKGNG